MHELLENQEIKYTQKLTAFQEVYGSSGGYPF